MTRRSLFGSVLAAVAAGEIPLPSRPVLPDPVPASLDNFDERFEDCGYPKIGVTLNLRIPPRFITKPVPVMMPIPVRFEHTIETVNGGSRERHAIKRGL